MDQARIKYGMPTYELIKALYPTVPPSSSANVSSASGSSYLIERFFDALFETLFETPSTATSAATNTANHAPTIEALSKFGLKVAPSDSGSISAASMDAHASSDGTYIEKEHPSGPTSDADNTDAITPGDSIENTVQTASSIVAQPPSLAVPFGLHTPAVLDPSVLEAVQRLKIVAETQVNEEDGTFTMTLDQAIDIIGADEFELTASCPRRILRLDSEFRRHEAGLPRDLWIWLIGSPAEEIVSFGGHNLKNLKQVRMGKA
ncbi:hypothetical protein NX059_007579 [Plenodomus lindquistii]|nr:hypothetical protein NX059_007579 [Plenodomus lindquistii]